ncbi:MAG: thiolase family protein [Ketobacteraceae bacterium]|nr:thiolase family protein [Ketobacteraceae bacterium]
MATNNGFADTDVLVLEGARTPFGRFMGGLQHETPTRLATVAARGAISRAGIDPQQISSIVLGNVLQAASDAAYLPRHVGLATDAPVEADALIVSRACGSGLEAVIQAARAIRTGEAHTVLAGGTETMSMVPYVLRGARQGYPMGHRKVEDYLLQSLFDSHAGCVIGQTVEHLAKEFGISRAAADQAAVSGQQRALAARERGYYAEEMVPVTPADGNSEPVTEDESPRPHTTLDGIATLPSLFAASPQDPGVVTAGNSTGLTDGAAVVVITSGQQARRQNLRPLGRIVAWGVAGVAPRTMGIGPVPATRKALAMAGLQLSDMDVIELNDAFTVQSIAVQQQLGLDPEKVNPNGGAIALGHPMGATGTRLILSALYHLRRQSQRYGLCTLCIGGGQGISVIVENLS